MKIDEIPLKLKKSSRFFKSSPIIPFFLLGMNNCNLSNWRGSKFSGRKQTHKLELACCPRFSLKHKQMLCCFKSGLLRSCEKKILLISNVFHVFSLLSGQVFIICPNVLNSCWIEKMFWSILFWLSNVSKNKIIWLKIRRIWQIVGRWVKM